VKFCKDFN